MVIQTSKHSLAASNTLSPSSPPSDHPTLTQCPVPAHPPTHPQGLPTMASSPSFRPLPLLLVLLLVLLLSSTTAFLLLPSPSSSPHQLQHERIVRRGAAGRPAPAAAAAAAAGVALSAAGAAQGGKGEEEEGGAGLLEGKNEGMVSRRHRRTLASEEQREMRASR